MDDNRISAGGKETDLINFGITYIRPCVTEAGKVSAETRLAPNTDTSSDSSPDVLDSSRLCWILNVSQIFSHVKCSEKLGIAKMETNGKTIVVSKGGRVNVRAARDNEDALVTTRLATRALWPVMICSNCGKAIVECASGSCASCELKECQLLTHGPLDPTRTVSARFSSRTVTEILTELEIEAPPSFYEARRRLDEAFQTMKDMVVAVSSGNDPDNVENTVTQKLDEGNRLAVRLIIEGGRQIDASGGLILLGVAANLEVLNGVISSLTKSLPSNQKGFDGAWKSVTSAYEALWKKGPSELGIYERPRKAREARRLKKGRGVNVVGDIGRITGVSLRLSRMMTLRLAV